jgi:hypothetical protein
MSSRLAAVAFTLIVTPWTQPASAQDPPDRVQGVREFTESGTWQVPGGVTQLTVELWGAGGGGAGGASAAIGTGPGGGGAGGGSGAYLRTRLAVTPGETYTIRIGAGGQGGRGESRGPAQPGADGEDTSIVRNGEIVLSVKGGRGGGAPKYGDSRGGAAGVGGPSEALPSAIARSGNSGRRGQDGGFAEWNSTPGGTGGVAIVGTLQPKGSFGGEGGTGRHFGYSDDGLPGGPGSVVITW